MSFVCVYIYIFLKKKIKKKFKISKSFPKKREKFSNEKSLWTRGIEPLSYLKKKKFFELVALDFLVTFSKRPIFFFQRFQDSLKSHFQNGT